jgi:hypothetical protein
MTALAPTGPTSEYAEFTAQPVTIAVFAPLKQLLHPKQYGLVVPPRPTKLNEF